MGTAIEYFEFRGLEMAAGTRPAFIGDAVLGAGVAEQLALGVGDSIMSDQIDLYDLSQTYPLKMKIVGVFTGTGTPDDHAVFVDVKTAWTIDGKSHGHTDVAKNAPKGSILEKTATNITVDSSIIEYNEITEENIRTFHFHGNPAGFPVMSIVVIPHDGKAATMLKGRYNVSKDRQMIGPFDVIGELMGIVFRVEMFFKANFVIVLVSTVLFLALVVVLSMRLREREMTTMFRIGCSRRTIFWLQTAELGIVLVMSMGAAGVLSAALVLLAPELVTVM